MLVIIVQNFSLKGNYPGEKYYVCKTVFWSDYGEKCPKLEILNPRKGRYKTLFS
jgi:hypothetical protein